MPPKRRATESATPAATGIAQEQQQKQKQDSATDATTTTGASAPSKKGQPKRTSATPETREDLNNNVQDKQRPIEMLRDTPANNPAAQTVSDATIPTQEQQQCNQSATDVNTTRGPDNGNSTTPITNTGITDTINAADTSTDPTPASKTQNPRKRPFKARGPRGPYKPRKPKPTDQLPPPPPESGIKLLKTSNELAFKDTRPWHDYFQHRIPTFNISTSLWELPPPPPRVDVLAPEELDKMIKDDYARMKPLAGERHTHKQDRSDTSATTTSTLEPQQQTTPSDSNEAGQKREDRGDTSTQHDSDSDSQWVNDNVGSDSDDNDGEDDDDDDDNRRSQSLTPGLAGNVEGHSNGNDDDDSGTLKKRRKTTKKHRRRISYRFPAPVPPLEYPYLQSAFPYENHQPPKQQSTTQPDYGRHTQPLPDVWHRPQGGFAMEDLFSQEKLDYSIRMLRKQPVEAKRLRMDLYYRRGFQLASKQVLDRARVAFYGKNDYTNKHYLQVPSLYNEIDEARLRSTEASRKDINILRSLDIKGKLDNRDHSLLRATPSAANAKPPTQPTTSTKAAMTAMRPMSSGTGVVGNPSSTSAPPSSSTLSNQTSRTNFEVEENSEALARDRLAYYEVNQFLGSMFSHRNLGGKLLSLSPRACTILRTLMNGLEKKMVSMGCELQRAELTVRLAEIDTFLSKRHREMTKARKGKTKREESQPVEASSPDSSLPTGSSSSTPASAPSMSPAEAAGHQSDPTGPNAVAALERRFYPLWDCDPGEYYIRTATSTNPFTHASSLTGALDDPLTQDHTSGEGENNNNGNSPFLVANSSSRTSQAGSSGSTPRYGAMASSTATTTTTATESGYPFIHNPLRIPDEMEPFWRVRNFLERTLSTSASASAAVSASASTMTPSTLVLPTPSSTTTDVANKRMMSDIERLRKAQQDFSASQKSSAPTSFSSASTQKSSAPTSFSSASTATPISASISSVLALTSKSALAPLSTTTTATMITDAIDNRNLEIERLRQAQQAIAAASAVSAAVSPAPSSPSPTPYASVASPSTSTSVMNMTSEIERLRLAQQELARASSPSTPL